MKEKNVILIVDDYKEQADTLKLVLKKEGYGAESAYSGTEALAKAAEYPFDAAILDINLPDIEGVDLIEKMKGINPEMVIIMLTGFPSQENTMTALNKGAAGYLVKPTSREKLVNMLEDKLAVVKDHRDITQEKMGEFMNRRLEKLRKMDP